MRGRGRTNDPTGRSIVVRAVSQFAFAGLVAAAIVGLALAIASRRVGEREAIGDAREKALARAQAFVAPALTKGVIDGNRRALAELDAAVRADVLDEDLVRVKIWSADGVVLYSDEPRLVGQEFVLGADDLEAFESGMVEAEVSDLDEPENRYERRDQKLLEVYLPIAALDGTRLLFEAYFGYDAVVSSGSRIWSSVAPISLGALAALELVQIPLAWSLARQLRQRQQAQERLLQRAVDASERERRSIATDLHDGVVQDLAGVALALSGTARRARLPEEAITVLDQSADEVRESIRTLRSLLIDIYPPNLADEGLASALDDLAVRARARGLDMTVDADAARLLPPTIAALFYRTTQEALRNVLKHAKAKHVEVTVRVDERSTVLCVADDGVGFEPASLSDGPRAGHFGLHGLKQLVDDAGGVMRIESLPNAGTRLEVEVATT